MAHSTWQRIPVIIRSIISGLLVTFSGLLPWSILFGINITVSPAFPWSVMGCLVYLFFWNRFVRGNTELIGNAYSRAKRYRATAQYNYAWVYATGGAFSIGIFLLMVASYKYFEIPIQELPIKNVSPLVVAVYFAMASFVAGLCEEVGFRGYLQQPIESKYGALVSVIISSTAFTVLHFGGVEALPLMPFYLLGGVNFGLMAYWSKSLRPSIILHTVTNFLSYLILWLGADLFRDESHNSLFTSLLVVGILMLIVGSILAYLKVIKSKGLNAESVIR